jgi:hypothetical protein
MEEPILVWLAHDDEVANEIRIADSYDPELRALIEDVVEFCLDDDEEIFETGESYIITEKGIYVACYPGDIDNLYIPENYETD